MTTVYAEVKLGESYAWGDRERFPSIAAVLHELRGGDDPSWYRPCDQDWPAGEYAAYIFRDWTADYPAYVVEVGPRGGLRVVPA